MCTLKQYLTRLYLNCFHGFNSRFKRLICTLFHVTCFRITLREKDSDCSISVSEWVVAILIYRKSNQACSLMFSHVCQRLRFFSGIYLLLSRTMVEPCI